ncbi:MAG: class I SAM-dependent methyltransferase [Actinomycetota bacterium]
MCSTHHPAPASSDADADAAPEPSGLDDRIVTSAIGTLELFGVYLGIRLGLYQNLAADGPATSPELARRAGIDERYAREWLEQQAVAGYLTVEDASASAQERRFDLPEGHHGFLADPTDGGHVAPLAQMVVGVANTLDEVVEAYRTGAGVPYEHYGADFRNGQGGINRPAFENDLVDAWLPAVVGVADTLDGGGSIADVGCGQGYSTVAIAGRWPQADVIGVDVDAASVADARAVAQAAGSTARFAGIDGSGLPELGPFNVITMLECLHDMAHPVEALVAARKALADDGVLVIADELVADEFHAPGDELERMMYGWSISHCLPACRTEPKSAELGTVVRASTIESLCREAGFATVEVVDVDGGFFRIYAVRP